MEIDVPPKQKVFYYLTNPRFSFKWIGLIILGLVTLWYLFTLSVLKITPKGFYKETGTAPTIDQIQSLHYVWTQLHFAIFYSLFYYVELNLLYGARKLHLSAQFYVLYIIIGIGVYGAFWLSSIWLFPDGQERIDSQIKSMGSRSIFSFYLVIGLLIIISINALILFFLVNAAIGKDARLRNQALLEENNKLEIEKLKAEYNFLKAQINPHFLQNSLNFLYSKSLPFSPELSEGILTISEIMRYALRNNTDSQGFVLLDSEIDHIRNIIHMNQLRFSNQLQIAFHLNSSITNVKILPLLLITLVENAFKHGDVLDPDFPLQIDLSIKDNFILFDCKNKKKTGPKEMSFGIGLNNTKRRIEMVYKKEAFLDILDKPDSYEVHLKIPVRKW